MSFDEQVKLFTKEKSKWTVFIISMLLLLIATYPCNIAWYHNSGNNETSNRGFLMVLGISMFYATIEYLIMLPANQMISTKFTLFQSTLMSYVALLIGTLFYLWYNKGLKLTYIHLISSVICISGLILGLQSES